MKGEPSGTRRSPHRPNEERGWVGVRGGLGEEPPPASEKRPACVGPGHRAGLLGGSQAVGWGSLGASP